MKNFVLITPVQGGEASICKLQSVSLEQELQIGKPPQ